MLKILIVSLALIASIPTALADVAHDDEPYQEQSAQREPSQIPLTHNGVAGVWFRADAAELLLREVHAARLETELAVLYEEKIALIDEELEASGRLRDLAEQGELRAADNLDRALLAKLEVEKQRDAWHRSPAVWFASGACAAVLAIAVGAYAVTR